MATSAFRSTTRRTPIAASASPTVVSDDSSSSSARRSAPRRSRSLSRFSRRLPDSYTIPFSDASVPRGRFVNTVRGSGFPEISLDDLAIDFFSPGPESEARGRSAARDSDVSPTDGGTLSQRRGRSVARNGRVGPPDRRSSISYTAASRGKAAPENRQRRSLSVVRCPISDSENDLDHSHQFLSHGNLKNLKNGSNQRSNQRVISEKPAATTHRQGIRRCMSQREFKCYDGDSSQSSALTDEEVSDTSNAKDGKERTIHAVYAQRKAKYPTDDAMKGELYQVMREEIRHAVEDIKIGIEQVISKGTYDSMTGDALPLKNSDDIRGVSTIRRSCSNKIDQQSEKHKQDILAEMVMEEPRGREFSHIVRELLPEPNTSVSIKPSWTRRINDRSRMSETLTEEAEKYIEDFISNVEDTDISSLDGERSDTSSTLGGRRKVGALKSFVPAQPLPDDMDGVVLPWLQWETSNDVSSQSSCNKKMESPATPVSSMIRSAARGEGAYDRRDSSGYSASSRGSWNPDTLVIPLKERGLHTEKCPSSSVDADDYLKATTDEDFLFERWSQNVRISSGGLLICHNNSFF